VLMEKDASFTIHQAFIARYFNAIGVAILLHDHVTSMDDEVEYIWKAKTSVPKVFFLLVRYTMPLVLFVNSYQQSSSNTGFPDTFCKVWFNLAAFLFVVVFAIENFLILLRVWVLNDRKRSVVKWTGLFYLIIQVTSFSYMIAIMVTATEHFRFMLASNDRGSNTRLCSIESRSILPGAYIPSITFEAVMIVLILWGTHIRSRNMANKSLTNYLVHDGFVYILFQFLFRIANMLITASAPPPLIFTSLCFGSATSAMAVSRLIIGMRKESVNRRRMEVMYEDRSLTTSAIDVNYRKPVCAREGPGPSSARSQKDVPT